jgi:predicted Zn-dependent peptidase
MIKYERHTLQNGLRVLLHHDATTPLVAINMLYDVGSRDEDPEHTGFAHLFEHLMFGGSEGAESFDDPIQNAGGDCNAFTNSDVTNFFSILPAENLPLGLFLEADRMHRLVLNEKVLDTQRKVVIEEFKETCLNQPYGDIWHVLAPLAYQKHPYKWPTIGDRIEHIAASTIDDVARFYKAFYGPNNAICVICGNYDPTTIMETIETYFGQIPARPRPLRSLNVEPPQDDQRRLVHRSDIPTDSIFMAFHMPSRTDNGYYTADLISDLLASGRSSRLYQA